MWLHCKLNVVYLNTFFSEGLSNLIVLNLSHNKIKIIPTAIKRWIVLSAFILRVILTRVAIQNVNVAFDCFHLQPFKFGKIQHCRQSAWRDSCWVGAVSKLTEMNVARNKLSEIPQELWKLTRLRKLSLARNSLRELPEVGSGFPVVSTNRSTYPVCLMHCYTVVLEWIKTFPVFSKENYWMEKSEDVRYCW